MPHRFQHLADTFAGYSVITLASLAGLWEPVSVFLWNNIPGVLTFLGGLIAALGLWLRGRIERAREMMKLEIDKSRDEMQRNREEWSLIKGLVVEMRDRIRELEEENRALRGRIDELEAENRRLRLE